MGLETATYISDLVETNPTSADKRRQGDDHLRLTKSVLKASFPTINGPVNATLAELNRLAGVTSNVQQQLDTKLTSASIDLTPYAEKGVSNAWTRTQATPVVDLGQEAGNFVVNASLSDTFKVELIGDANMTFSNLVEGQSITIKVIQGAGAPHLLTYPAVAQFSFGIAPVLSAIVGQYDLLGGKVIDGIVILGFLGDIRNV